MNGLSEESAEVIFISALNHYVYCPRRCALIHVDGEFINNIHTQRGNAEHEKADQIEHICVSEGVRIEYALPVWSERLGLSGRCDVVEFHADGTVYPVEYKHGALKKWVNDDLQLTAQAICLEEMLDVSIERGAIFHNVSHHRREVMFTAELRRLAKETAAAVRTLLATSVLPPPVNDRRCPECSLRESCLPTVVAGKGRNRKAARELFEVKP
jgi:CRISPR-associated exonuclease Cas4